MVDVLPPIGAGMNTSEQYPELIGTATAARLLGIHRKIVRRLVEDGVLREVRYSPRSNPRYVRGDVLRLLAAGCGQSSLNE